MIPEDSSVFNLSRLDDFSRFVRETAINDDIYHKIQSKLPKSDIHTQNLLNVVDEADLANNFYGTEEGCEEEGEETSRKKKLFKIKSWKMGSSSNGGGGGGGHSPSLASKSDFSGMNYAQSESSSSNKEPRFLDRKLSVRHLQMISFGGTIGVGLFLNSGKAITIAGGFGAVLAFTIVGVLVLCTLTSFSEMVTFVSVIDGVSGLSSRFIDDAFGFAAGWLYFCSFSFGVAGEIVAAVIMLSYYGHLDTTSNSGSTAGFVCLFLVLIVSSNLLPIRYFGELEYVSSFVKLLWAFIMMVIMVVLNRGGFPNTPVLGFKYWNHSKSDFENNIIFGLFRPSFNLHDSGTDPPGVGIGGDKGRFLSLLTAILVVCYAYSGTEVVCIAACEAKNPRKALPSATRRVFWRIIIFYVISSFLVTLNIYAGDPRLLRYSSGSTGIDASQFGTNPAVIQVGGAHCNADSKVVAGFGSGAQSPWIVALQSASLCQFSSVTNGFLVFFAVSCGNAQLYVSSRTVYSLALQGKAPKIFTYCNRFGTPYNAVLFAGAFGLLAFTCVNESATVVFQNLTSLISSSGIFVWFTMCLTFIRFYFGLKRRPDILDRNDRSYPYKSPFQPYAAIVGAVGTLFIILAMGFVVFLNGQWDTMFFFSSYGSLIAFTALYIGYRVIKGTSIPSLDKLDFDSGRTEMDRYIWDGGRSYNKKNAKEVIYKWISFLA
ncbi:SSY1 SPS-sensor component SSY1 [Candida maltosa Xu316]